VRTATPQFRIAQGVMPATVAASDALVFFGATGDLEQVSLDLAAFVSAWLPGAKGIELPLQEEVAHEVSTLPVRLYKGTSGAHGVGVSAVSLSVLWTRI